MKIVDTKDAKLEWDAVQERTLLETVVFDVEAATCRSPDGADATFFVMDAHDWCIVIPEIAEDFLMVRQWRPGQKALSTEFPGGVVDDGELPEHAARRELQEETGYTAQTLIHLASMNPNPALFKNHVHFFLAQNLTSTNERHLDDDEYINVCRVKKETVIASMGTGEYCHALMAACMGIYLARK